MTLPTRPFAPPRRFARAYMLAPVALVLAILFQAVSPFRAEARRPRLPEIRLSANNQVPVCVTPKRLMAYMHSRNRSRKLRRLYKNIAYYYKKHGEALRVRWDYAFFQTLIETNYLTYKTGRGRWGDVNPKAFNFAGIGTTGGGVPGNHFKDVSTGVKAQMQHLIAYSGEMQKNPTAPRTRLKQRDIVELSRKLRRPVRFDDLAGRWAVDRKYANSIEWVARGFRKKYCTGRMLQIAKAEARKRAQQRKHQNVRSTNSRPRLARPRLANIPKPHRATRTDRRFARAAAKRAAIRERERTRQLAAYHQRQRRKEQRVQRTRPTLVRTQQLAQLRAQKAQQRRQRSNALARKALINARRNDNNTRSALGVPPGFKASPRGSLRPQAARRCTVVTASYGGRKTLLIKASSGGTATYTALSVLAGFEKSMTASYVRSNAAGGVVIGEYTSQGQALARAFALCPDK